MDIEGTSDIYIIAYIEQKEKQTTDVHYRCQTGCGSFNWRMLLPIHTPTSPNKLTIQVYDNDIFSSDDFICGAEINLQNFRNYNMNTPYFHTCNIIKWKIGGLENEENVMCYAEPDYGSESVSRL